MGIFDEGDANVVQQEGPSELARRVSQDLNASVKVNNIASAIHGNTIKLMGQSRGMLEITCEAANSFRLNEGAGPLSRELQKEVAIPPRWSAGGPSYTQSEMVLRVKTWLDEQRS